MEINNGFDEEKCEIAINKVIEENIAMRTRISENKGEAMQYFAPFNYEKIEIVDVSSLSKKEFLEYIDGLAFQSFFENDKKLYEFKILKKSEDKGYIFMRVHHIISDAWSCSKIVKSLVDTLESLSLERVEEKEKSLNPGYDEYIISEEDYQKSEKYTKDEEFWQEYLKGFEEVVSLKDKKKTDSFKAVRYSVKLEKDLNEKIVNYCKENKISPYVLFLTAIATYIYRVKDKNDFVLGTPVLNRSNFKEKQMLGMFVSTLPLRIKVEENISFLELAKEISKNNFSMFRHQKYPYSKMLEYVHKNSDIKNNLYNIAVSFQNAKTDIFDKEKYVTNWSFSNSLDDELQIHISDMDDTGILNINYDYKEELFANEEMKYIHLRLMAIIENAINDTSVNVENIQIMPASEKNKILYEFNDTKKDYPKEKTVIELFEEQVRKTPENIALVFEGKEMNYATLNEKANRLAHFLVEEENIKPNDVVGLVLNRSFEVMIGILAVLKAGATYIPIDPNFPEDRIKYMTQNSNAKIILTNVNADIFNIATKNINKIKGKDSTNLNIKNNLEDTFFILYTSGSTGRPKGVKVTHNNMLNLVSNFKNNKMYDGCKTAVSLTTISFDIFIYESLVSIINGLKLVIANEEEQKLPSKLNLIIQKYEIDILQMTPTRFKLLLDNIDKVPFIKNVKNIVLAGEQLPLSIKNEIASWKSKIYNGYGPTECTVFASFTDCTELLKISIGKPLNNLKFYILDKKERLLPLGCIGELYIGGAGVSKGYVNNDELTKKSFKNINDEIVYKSGDICVVDFDLMTYCFGRQDNQIKIRGLRIETSEIEEVIKKEETVKECVVTKQEYEGKEYLVAFVTGDSLDKIQIKKNISKILPMYMVPNMIFEIEEMPYTQNGKIDIKKLSTSKEYYNQNKKELKEIVDPVNNIQKAVYEYIEELRIVNSNISINDNFFEIGLDSLNLMELLIYINNKFDIELAVKDLMKHSTISDISELIEKKLENKSEKKNINKIAKKFGEYYKLTQPQLRIFSTYTSNPDSIIYNMPVEVKLSKNIDCFKLQDCIEKVINENDAFSLLLNVIDSNVMFTSKNEYIKIDCINTILEERYLELRTDFVRPFDLLNEKLFRVQIYKTEKNVYLLFDVHHIICDGVSLKLFFNEVIRKYNGISENKVGSFKNCLLSNNETKNTEKYKTSKKFFDKMFEDGITSTSIKLDKKRKNKRTYNGNKVEIEFDCEMMENINKYVKTNKLTHNSLFFSVLNIVLSKYTCKDEVLLGVATIGRKKIEQNNTIGMFVKTLPCKTKINYNNEILDYLENVKQDMFALIDNDAYSIDELISDLNIKKSNNRNTLFDIMYNYQNIEISDLEIEGKEVLYKSLLDNIAKFDITFDVLATNENIKVSLEYNKDLYNKVTMKNFLNIFSNTLNNLIKLNNTEKLSKLKIISKREEEYIVEEYNKSNRKLESHDRVITKVFKKIVKKNPHKVAVYYNNVALTYKELDEKSNQIANMLLEKGVSKNDIVAIMLDKSIELLPGILGVLKIGAVYLPIDYELPDERIKYMLENSRVKYIISKSQIFRKITPIPVLFINSDNNELNQFSKTILNTNVDILEQDNAYIMYTSGSTGKPKGVMIPNKGVVRLVKDTNYINITENDRVLLSGTIVFDASVFEMWLAILNGLTLYIIDKKDLLDPVTFEKYINENKITITLLTASLLNQLVIYKKDLFKNFNYLITGGDVMNSKVANTIITHCKSVKLINAYGPTENSVISSIYKYENVKNEEVPIGKPISFSNCYIIDQYGNLLPKGVPGELVVGGDGVANGYVNNKELTDERFITLPYIEGKCYKTGDMAKFKDDYDIDFIGRIDNQVKIRGYRIELDEIKTALFNIDKVKDAYVRIVENKNSLKSDKVILAYYVSDVNLDADYLKLQLKKVLPSYMIPNNVIKMQSFPLTINGKIDKNKLPIEIISKKREIILPRNNIEQKLYNIWQELLPNIEISINDNFFEIGGDSLLATQFVTKSMVNGLNYTYSDIYNYPTIMKLAESNSAVLEEMYGISKYQYSKINEYLESKYNKENNLEKLSSKGILLTGVTGFLGAHILANLLDNTNLDIYCIVRSKDNKNVKERVKEKLNFFFKNKYDKYIDNRIIIIEGDISKKDFGLEINVLTGIIKNIQTVIHVAAIVKHYGEYDKFVDLNIGSTEKIAEFCLINNKRMMYISTLSNSGNMLEGGQVEQDKIKHETIYDEKSMYIEQKLYNAYVYSKYIGEYKVLRKALKGLEMCIIRTGNLTGRYTDGKYQPNVEENAFANRIKSFVNLGKIPENMLDMYVEYTPIDYASDAIVKLSELKELPAVIHLFNHNHVYMPQLIEILNNIDVNLEVVNDEKFKELIEEKLTINSNDIEGIIVDLNAKKEIKYLSNIVVDSKYSIALLKKIGFEWPKITSEYVIRYLKYLQDIDFIKLDNKIRGEDR